MTDRYRSGAYAADNPEWHAEDAPHKAAEVLELLGATGWRPRSVVDVGCGTGHVLAALAEHLDARLDGWDVAPDALARAPSRSGVHLHLGDALTLAAPADLALALDVVEHVADDVAFLEALGRLSERLILRVPLDVSALDVVRPARLLAARRQWGHRHLYTRHVIGPLLEEAGWTVVAARLRRVPPPRDTLRRAWVDAARRAAFAAAPGLTVDLLGGWSAVVAATRSPGARSAQGRSP